jgi:DNA replication protein DnaC
LSATSHIAVTHYSTAEATCKWCRKPFETEIAHFVSGKTLQANVCDSCHEERKRMERPEIDLERRKMWWDRKVGSYFYIFEPAKVPPAMQPYYETALSWKPSPRGIGFMGKSRSGKSKVITELGRRLYIEGHDVFPTSGIEFGEKVASQVTEREEWEHYINRCKTCKVLLLDDSDKIKWTEACESAFYGMLETRRRFERPILVTVNVNGQEMTRGASLNRGEPIVNRLRDLCEIIELK